MLKNEISVSCSEFCEIFLADRNMMGWRGRGPTTTVVGEGLIIVTEDEFVIFVFHIDNQILCFCALSFGIEFKGIWITSLVDIQKSPL